MNVVRACARACARACTHARRVQRPFLSAFAAARACVHRRASACVRHGAAPQQRVARARGKGPWAVCRCCRTGSASEGLPWSGLRLRSTREREREARTSRAHARPPSSAQP
eukprot:5631463-Pleurochrysis_carterae.AAC.1